MSETTQSLALPTPPSDPVQFAVYSDFFSAAIAAFLALPPQCASDYSASRTFLLNTIGQST